MLLLKCCFYIRASSGPVNLIIDREAEVKNNNVDEDENETVVVVESEVIVSADQVNNFVLWIFF